MRPETRAELLAGLDGGRRWSATMAAYLAVAGAALLGLGGAVLAAVAPPT